MEYEQLTPEYIADQIAENMYQREIEHLHYQLNIDTFQATIDTLDEKDPYREYLTQRIVKEQEQQSIGEKAYQALRTLIKDPVAHQEAIERTKQKREAKEAAALSEVAVSR